MAKKNQTQKTETAPEAYARLAQGINEQVRNLEFRLQIHEGSHRDRPADWGLVGDLGRVKELLGEALQFIGVGR